jgi:glutamyl-tRNA synthetase
MTPPDPPRGRWAPSPTGLLHVGSARTALAAWLSVRGRGGTLVYRLEDLDPPRVVAGAAAEIAADLAWLGLDWDEGPDRGGPYAPYEQSARGAIYDAALERLAFAGRLFPCRRSRKDLAGLSSAPHAEDGAEHALPYPREWRPDELPPEWFPEGSWDAALRFRVDDRPVRFVDRIWGEIEERVGETVGDFVLKRRDGFYAYQLAVVVDDLAMRIGEVVRGADLLESTARQIQLVEALGGRAPSYAHVPLLVDAAGRKLSKREGSLTVRAIRDAGVTAEALIGYLGFSLGLLPFPAPRRPTELVELFAWDKIRRDPWRLPENLASELA